MTPPVHRPSRPDGRAAPDATTRTGRRGVRGGGEATRQAILAAARELFASRGYDQVGLREIAAAAGATAALVNRYFGSKEQLFRAVLDSGKPAFFGRLLSDRSRFGETVARLIAHGERGPAPEPDAPDGPSASRPARDVSYIVHSLGSPTVMAMLRELLDEELVPRLAEWLGGRDARLRAEAVYACFLGVHALQQVVGTAALKRADAQRLVAVLAPMLQACVDGPAPPAESRATEQSMSPGTTGSRRSARRPRRD